MYVIEDGESKGHRTFLKMLIQFILKCNFCLNTKFFQDEIVLQKKKKQVLSLQSYIYICIDKIYMKGKFGIKSVIFMLFANNYGFLKLI